MNPKASAKVGAQKERGRSCQRRRLPPGLLHAPPRGRAPSLAGMNLTLSCLSANGMNTPKIRKRECRRIAWREPDALFTRGRREKGGSDERAEGRGHWGDTSRRGRAATLRAGGAAGRVRIMCPCQPRSIPPGGTPRGDYREGLRGGGSE